MESSVLTRRRLLQQGSRAIAAAAFFRGLSLGASEAHTSVMSELSRYMAVAKERPLPDEVVEAAKLHTLDTFAAMISGSQLPPGRAAIQFARLYGGAPVATVVASRIVCGPIEAALTNGMLAHSDETDDSHAPSESHPGCAIIPAAFATGEQFEISGMHFLRAVVLGYDIGTRVGMAVGGLDFEVKTHRDAHNLTEGFGSAAACGCVASLNSQQMRWLLDYASQQYSGVYAWQRDTDHIEKAFVFGGMPARDGATAALVVKSGWTGLDDIFSGSNNFLLSTSPDANPASLVEKLGERYEINRTGLKKWTVGSPIQAPLDAVELLLKKYRFNADQVQQVIVRGPTQEMAIVTDRTMPDICLEHMIAIMLIDKTVSFRSSHDKARMQDPEVLRQRQKIKLAPSEDLQKRLPRREAIVEIRLVDGRQLSEHVEAVRGSAENPMTRDDVKAKSRDLISPVLGEEACKVLIENIVNLERVKDLRDLRLLLQI
jgi:2-methylcitrate dehydratase PrpD